MIGKTAAYTLCKNEIKKIDQWLFYTKEFDYRVILDTGSTDGTYELLKKVPNIILHQETVTPFHFAALRNKNLNMVPDDVRWALSPDMDEYFSINVLTEIEKTVKQNPGVTNISCDRLDIYSDVVRVGPPKLFGTNKIHLRHEYYWKERVYEHLKFKRDGYEVEIYNNDIYLIHDQDISKPRSNQYHILMEEEFKFDPFNNWNNWYLLNYYFRIKDINNFIRVACNFVEKCNEEQKLLEVSSVLASIVKNKISTTHSEQIIAVLKKRGMNG